MTNTLSQQEINAIFNKIVARIRTTKRIKIERNQNGIEISSHIGREHVYLYARKKIQCAGFDQNSQIEMRVSSMCSAVTLTKNHISEIDDTISKAVNLFYLACKEARERHLRDTSDNRLKKKFEKQLKAKKVKYDTFISTKVGRVKGWVSVEKGEVNITIAHLSLEQANKLFSLIS